MPDPPGPDAAGPDAAGPDPGRPAYYAAGPGRWRDWWTLLHPPYTAWHLSYVVIGASLAPRVVLSHLLYAVAAFFLAVGVAAHALDELHGRPLRTEIPAWALIAATVASLAGAVGLGVYGITQTGWLLLPFMVVGPALVVAYNLELFGGIVHNDAGFAAAWGAFPALTGYAAQDGTLGLAALAGAAAAFALSAGQRRLSTPARTIRRRAVLIDGTMTLADGTARPIGPDLILAPLEGALRALSWGLILLAAALATARLR
jgi:hypothetical protein